MKNLLLFFLSLTLISCVQGQTTIDQIAVNLSSGKSSVSDILTNPSYMNLHPQEAFRQLIKKYAKQEKIRLVTTTEPGTRITVKGKIIDKNQKPLSNVLIYVYHTDAKGWYADTAGHVAGREGDRRHARLFGYFKTMNDGSFEFNTIHPQGYPNSDLPQHIHFEVFSNEGNALIITELLFEEDRRLTASMRQHMLNEGAFIAANKSRGKEELYTYEVVTR